jgi:antitoxin component YwqK of YwqJK toxin-antitoxin module
MTGPGFNRIFSTLFQLAVISVWSNEIRQKETHFPDGKIKEHYSYYLDEKKREVRDGLAEEFFPGGTKKGEIQWQAGKENGFVVYYHPNGRKSYEANYLLGKKTGFATVWYENGQKQWQTVFLAGLTHGVWREWYLDGKKKFEANYNDGKLQGLATWWHDNGHIWQERTFLAGQLVTGSVREWDKVGRQLYPLLDNQGTDTQVPLEPGKRDPSGSKTDSVSVK